MAIDGAQRKLLCLRYADYTFIIWKHGIEDLHVFLYHLNNLRKNHQIQYDSGVYDSIPFLDILVTEGEPPWSLWYRKTAPNTHYMLSSLQIQLFCVERSDTKFGIQSQHIVSK